MLWRGTLNEPGNVSFTSATVNGKPAKMLPGNVFEALLPMVAGPNAVTLEARDTTGNVATKTYDITITGDGASYSYDANGNLTQKVEGADTCTYEWNAENQLLRVTKNGAEQARFAYDPLGRRVEKVGSTTGTSAYAYDGEDILRLSTGATVMKYVHGPGSTSRWQARTAEARPAT
jgi:YD repeat-containing protein